MLKIVKYNIIHELGLQRSRAGLNQACKECEAKMSININPNGRARNLSLGVSCIKFFLSNVQYFITQYVL